MARAIKLSVLTGPHCHVRYCFRAKTTCMVGRASDCPVQFAGYRRDARISRHHCKLEIDPPKMWIVDLGSSNGTFVNGKNIANGKSEPEPFEIADPEPERVELRDGDVVTIGGTTLKFSVIDCPFTALPEENLEETNKNRLGLHLDTDGCTTCDGECLRARHSELLLDNSTVLWIV